MGLCLPCFSLQYRRHWKYIPGAPRLASVLLLPRLEPYFLSGFSRSWASWRSHYCLYFSQWVIFVLLEPRWHHTFRIIYPICWLALLGRSFACLNAVGRRRGANGNPRCRTSTSILRPERRSLYAFKLSKDPLPLVFGFMILAGGEQRQEERKGSNIRLERYRARRRKTRTVVEAKVANRWSSGSGDVCKRSKQTYAPRAPETSRSTKPVRVYALSV